MLSKIFIQNFALIDQLEVQLQDGFQVITGETGAGKSIILGALRMILGERADAKNIADATQKSIVELEFVIQENLKSFFEDNDLDFDENTIIRREILPSGKSRAFVNDVPVTLDVLKSLSNCLIDIHSQFETSQLFDEEFQFKIIDGLNENEKLVVQFQDNFQEFKKIKSELVKLKEKLSEGNKEADYQKFLLNELEEVNLDEINWEELQDQLSMQENAENISENLSQILNRIDQEEIGLLDQLMEIRNRLSKTAELSHHFSELNSRFESQFVELKDFIFELQNEAEKIEVNPQLLDELNEKQNRLNQLFLKHQVNSVEELIEIREKIYGEQSGFEELENYIAETEEKLSKLEDQLHKQSEKLSQNRNKSVPVFVKKVGDLLKKLGLEKAKIEVELLRSKDFNPFGKDEIQILFQANSGFPLQPIKKAISGGERSRVMLSIKKLMAENAELPTLILDEIDTGVSGKVADEMGNVMREMSKNMQLVVITHLAQVASKGKNHFKVVKEEVSGKTQTTILPLQKEEKLQEIAQLLSGSEVTEAALKQAKELMK